MLLAISLGLLLTAAYKVRNTSDLLLIFTTYYLRLTTYDRLPTIYHLPLLTNCYCQLLLTTYYLQRTTRCSPLITFKLPFPVVVFSLPATRYML